MLVYLSVSTCTAKKKKCGVQVVAIEQIKYKPVPVEIVEKVKPEPIVKHYEMPEVYEERKPIRFKMPRMKYPKMAPPMFNSYEHESSMEYAGQPEMKKMAENTTPSPPPPPPAPPMPYPTYPPMYQMPPMAAPPPQQMQYPGPQGPPMMPPPSYQPQAAPMQSPYPTMAPAQPMYQMPAPPTMPPTHAPQPTHAPEQPEYQAPAMPAAPPAMPMTNSTIYHHHGFPIRISVRMPPAPMTQEYHNPPEMANYGPNEAKEAEPASYDKPAQEYGPEMIDLQEEPKNDESRLYEESYNNVLQRQRQLPTIAQQQELFGYRIPGLTQQRDLSAYLAALNMMQQGANFAPVADTVTLSQLLRGQTGLGSAAMSARLDDAIPDERVDL
ncbi:hypothetical protein HDE_05361 [Halotydeus destructor]|nr:hypothetical protein HDE_05361 [Halotydeus destructor]